MRQRLSIKARALQLLSQREHSRLELRRKLIAHAQQLALNEPAGRIAPRRERVASADDDAPHGSTLARRVTPAEDVPADARVDAPEDAPECAPRTRRAPPSPELLASVDSLLDQLVASGLLSETRFLEARVRTRAARHGNLRITQELARHGLALSADEARELKASEFARARDVWARKFGAVAIDPRERARQMRFLAGRGFSAEVIRRVLRAGADDD
jgi:regulatory protein